MANDTAEAAWRRSQLWICALIKTEVTAFAWKVIYTEEIGIYKPTIRCSLIRLVHLSLPSRTLSIWAIYRRNHFNITKFIYFYMCLCGIPQEAALHEHPINRRYHFALTAACHRHAPPRPVSCTFIRLFLFPKRHKPQFCPNGHATWPADANRDTASWMQAWSQWLFCSWHGLCLIGICRTDWSCGGGYGNAPAESIKWGDTLDHMMDRGLMSHRGSGAARTEVEEWEYHLRLWA